MAIQRGGDIGKAPPAKEHLHLAIEGRALLHPQHIGGEARIGCELGAFEHVAGEDLPFPFALDRDQNLAVSEREHAIGRDRGMGEPDPRRLDAAIAAGEIGHVHQFGERVEQRERDRRALAGARPLQQCLEDCGIGRLSRGDVGDRDADARRTGFGRAGDGGEARFRLDQQVIGLAPLMRRARRIAGDVAGDQPRMALSKRPAAEPEPVGRTGCQILDEDVGRRDHSLDQREVLRLPQVDPAGFLAPVDPDEIGGLALGEGVIAAREIAFRPLQLDHACAGIGELAARDRRGHRLLQRDHDDSFERIRHRHPLGRVERKSAPVTASQMGRLVGAGCGASTDGSAAPARPAQLESTCHEWVLCH